MSDEGIIESLYESAIIRKAGQATRKDVHVSDLTAHCIRAPWYRLRGHSQDPMTFKKAVPLVHGNQLHKIAEIGKVSELSMRANVVKMQPALNGGGKYDLVSGRLDDLIELDDEEIIVDKKTTAKSIPSKIPENYKWQLNIYKLLYYITHPQKKVIDRGAILWIDKSSGWKNVKAVFLDLLPVETIRDYVLDKLKILRSDKIPPRVTSPLCYYCPFLRECNPFGEST